MLLLRGEHELCLLQTPMFPTPNKKGIVHALKREHELCLFQFFHGQDSVSTPVKKCVFFKIFFFLPIKFRLSPKVKLGQIKKAELSL